MSCLLNENSHGFRNFHIFNVCKLQTKNVGEEEYAGNLSSHVDMSYYADIKEKKKINENRKFIKRERKDVQKITKTREEEIQTPNFVDYMMRKSLQFFIINDVMKMTNSIIRQNQSDNDIKSVNFPFKGFRISLSLKKGRKS